MTELKNFDILNINEELKAKLSSNGFTKMTKVQEMTIPNVIEEKDVVVQSPTGTGKTLAFLIPIINKIYNLKNCKSVVGLIISPTRELALQIKAVMDTFDVKSECFIGGINLEEDIEKLNCAFNIAVATPGRIFELISNNKKKFSTVKFLVLDEADKLLGFGFEQKLIAIIDQVPKPRTTVLLSATIDENINKLSRTCLRSPLIIKAVEETMPEELILEYMIVTPKDKIETLLNIIRGKKSIVFFATCSQIDFFQQLLSTLGIENVLKIHGKMSQKDRSYVYEKFQGSSNLLLCTDVAARGIDFKEIDLVVHFDIPKDYNNILHRSGRTARNGSRGESLIFIMPNEKPYTDFLRLKKIPTQLWDRNFVIHNESCINQAEAVDYSEIKKKITSELLSSAVKSFVSYIRSYKEHFLSFILDYKTLDYNSLAELYFLEKIPRMPELRAIKFDKFEKPVNSGEPRQKKQKDKKKKKFKH